MKREIKYYIWQERDEIKVREWALPSFTVAFLMSISLIFNVFVFAMNENPVGIFIVIMILSLLVAFMLNTLFKYEYLDEREGTYAGYKNKRIMIYKRDNKIVTISEWIFTLFFYNESERQRMLKGEHLEYKKFADTFNKLLEERNS